MRRRLKCHIRRAVDPDGKPKMKTLARKVDTEVERTRVESRLAEGPVLVTSYRLTAEGRPPERP